jgi:hypothetical protein
MEFATADAWPIPAGVTERELPNGRVHNRSIDRKFACYHEEAGNDAG